VRSFLPPTPPRTGPRWFVLSVVVHVVFLGGLVWVSTRTRETYEVTHLVRLYQGPEVSREHSMRLADPVGSGTRRGGADALRGLGPVSLAAAPVGSDGPPGARWPRGVPDSLSIGIPGASTTIPGAIVVGTRRRIGPAFGEGELWIEPDLGPAVEEQEWGAEETRLALAVAEMLADVINDTLAARGEVPSLIATIGGQKWGIDSQYIHLGPIKIPMFLASLLGFANLPQMGNYELAQQQAWLADVRNQILTQAQRMDQMDAFKRAVRELEARKRREREEERRRRGLVAGRDSTGGRN
jgi:hypothetical protein